MKRTVFLGGIPASGKSTIGNRLQEGGRVVHVGAGDLIKAAKNSVALNRVDVIGARDADDNQALLVAAFRELASTTTHPIILNGHFAVPTQGGPVPVAPSVFSGLGLTALAVLVVDPSVAAQRLAARPEKARWWDGSAAALERLQAAELVAARSAAKECSLPLMELTSNPERELLDLIGE